MIKFSIITGCLLLLGFVGTCQKRYPVLFVITQTIPYCGGANKTEDLQTADNKKSTPAIQSLYIIKGNKNTPGRKILQRFTMDKDGEACINLAAGTYSLINRFSYEKLTINKSLFDEACLKQLWATPLYTFTVRQNIKQTVIYNIQQLCEYDRPCAKFSNEVVPM